VVRLRGKSHGPYASELDGFSEPPSNGDGLLAFRVVWQNRARFLAIATSMMRRVLVDHGRRQRARKRGGTGTRVTLDDAFSPVPPCGLDLLAPDEALSELTVLDEQQARIVELRAFGGLSVEETAEALEISPARP
jgi:RNA polymerase sigma-70 factor (ECF subfamily)